MSVLPQNRLERHLALLNICERAERQMHRAIMTTSKRLGCAQYADGAHLGGHAKPHFQIAGMRKFFPVSTDVLLEGRAHDDRGRGYTVDGGPVAILDEFSAADNALPGRDRVEIGRATGGHLRVERDLPAVDKADFRMSVHQCRGAC